MERIVLGVAVLTAVSYVLAAAYLYFFRKDSSTSRVPHRSHAGLGGDALRGSRIGCQRWGAATKKRNNRTVDMGLDAQRNRSNLRTWTCSPARRR